MALLIFSPMVALASVVILGLVFVRYRLVRALRSPLRKLPGPTWARYTRLWLFLEMKSGRFEKVNLDLHRKYGPIVRVAPNEYSIDDLSAAKKIYGHSTQFIKSPFYDASGLPGSPTLFSDNNIKRHAENRRKVAATYSMSALLTMEGHVTECSTLFVKKLGDFASKGDVIDVTHWLQCYAFDVIGRVTFGERFGFLDDGKDRGGILDAIDKFFVYSALIGIYPEFHVLLFNTMQKLDTSGGGIAYINNFAEERIKQQEETGAYFEGDGREFISKLLKIHQENPKKLSRQEVMMTMSTNVGAGSDTSAISLSAILHYLIEDPEKMSKLRQEVEDLLASGTISPEFTFKDTQQMPYLQVVIKEALRLHPATGFILGRTVPAGGAELAGQYFPEGTVVGVNSWVAHNNLEVFGQDAASFRPERWLEDQERAAVMEKYYMPFGMGSRTCIGKNLSLMEIQNIVPQLVKNFDFEMVPKGGKTMSTRNLFFVKQVNFNCRISLRKN